MLVFLRKGGPEIKQDSTSGSHWENLESKPEARTGADAGQRAAERRTRLPPVPCAALSSLRAQGAGTRLSCLATQSPKTAPGTKVALSGKVGVGDSHLTTSCWHLASCALSFASSSCSDWTCRSLAVASLDS